MVVSKHRVGSCLGGWHRHDRLEQVPIKRRQYGPASLCQLKRASQSPIRTRPNVLTLLGEAVAGTLGSDECRVICEEGEMQAHKSEKEPSGDKSRFLAGIRLRCLPRSQKLA